MIDWTKPVCTKHETPHIGTYLGKDGERHRVEIRSPSSISGPPTVFRYGDDGRTRGDGAPSLADLTNFNPLDGVVRLNREGRKVCADQAA